VSGEGFEAGKGQILAGDCPPFRVTELGTLSFDVPQVERPARARLELRLIVGESQAALAQQELYFFPHWSIPEKETRIFSLEHQQILKSLGYHNVSDLSRADTAVVHTLDDSLRDFLLRGGRALLLAETDDALQTYIPGVGIQSRAGTPWQGDWASSFGWHRFASLPTDGVVDFAFADLTPEHVIHGFAPRDFVLDVYAGLFVGWLHKPIPTIARKRVGSGELLISTFRLAKNLDTNPLARHLFRELLNLLA
jgi:hypothetical protein